MSDGWAYQPVRCASGGGDSGGNYWYPGLSLGELLLSASDRAPQAAAAQKEPPTVRVRVPSLFCVIVNITCSLLLTAACQHTR